MNAYALLGPVVALVLSPLLPGVINRVKAFFAGRQGPPLLQVYADLGKLFRKGAVYSRTTTWVFRASPLVGFGCLVIALLLVPFGKVGTVAPFGGDLVVAVYLLALYRFFIVIGALDTGSSFEGMGASREVQFAVFAEPALLLGLACLVRYTGSLSLTALYSKMHLASWTTGLPMLSLVAAAFFIVILAENSRMPVDDPNTHLELTMIHEVMVLDHGGPDLGFIGYGTCLKLWIMGLLVVNMLTPSARHPVLDAAAPVIGLLALAVAIGIVESIMARLRLLRVPQLLVGACALSALAMLLTFR